MTTTPYNISVTINPAGAQQGGRQVEAALSRIEQRARSVQALVSRVFVGAAVLGAAREVVQVADAYTQLQNRLRVVTASASELAAVQEEIFDISQRTRTEFGANVEMYARLSLATRDLGVSARQLLDFQQTLNRAIILSGTSAQEARSGIFQLSQAMSKGRLDGDELRSVLENIPVVADVIARSLGVTRGELRALGEQGRITGDVILKAFGEAREEIGERFNTTIPTVAQSFVALGNSLTNFVGKVDELTGFSRSLANAVLTIAEAIDFLSKKAEDFRLDNLKSQLEAFKVERNNLLRMQDRPGVDVITEAFRILRGEKSLIDADRVERDLVKLYEDQIAVTTEIMEIEERRRKIAEARARLEQPGHRGNVPPSAAQENYSEILRRSNEQIDRENELLRLNAQEREVVGKLLQVEERLKRNKTPIQEGDKAALEERLRMLQEVRRHVDVVGDVFEATFQSMEDALVEFAATGKFTFSDFANSVVRDLMRIATQAYVTKPLMNAVTGLVNPGISSMVGSSYSMNGWANTVTPSLLGFANGGEFRVGGSGGTDSQVVAFRASPDETVSITKPGQSAGGGGVTVNVFNNTGAQVETKTGTDANGTPIVDVLVSEMKSRIAGGEFDGTLGARFGSRPSQRRR